ncbi:MAG: acyltransferase [Pyrinomonadaceae bacterium]
MSQELSVASKPVSVVNEQRTTDNGQRTVLISSFIVPHSAFSLRERLANIFELADANNPRRNLPMEGLRGLAVILVFFVHYHAIFKPWVQQGSFTFAFSNFLGTIGLSGVDLFFVLSGYLIYGMVFKKRNSYMSFIRRRIQRIYPTFLCVLAVYLLLSALMPADNKIPSDPFAATLFIAANILLLPGLFQIQPIITVAWSLSYEFFYYLFIPLIVVALGMRRWPGFLRIIFFLIIASLYVAYCFVAAHSHVHLIMFVSGILLFEAIYTYKLGEKVTTGADYLTLLIFILTFPLIYALTERPELAPSSGGKIVEIYRVIVLFFSFFVFTFVCFSSKTILKNIFSWAPLRWLGNMSYSYYLIHGLTLKAIALVMLRVVHPSAFSVVMFWLGYPLFFLMTLVSSAFLFVLIERRFSILPASSAPKQTKPEPLLSNEGVTVAPATEMNLP